MTLLVKGLGMIEYPNKKIYGLLGAPRAGKTVVGKYLQESRNFVALAFADKIKEEYGINNADFELAKISNNIEELRTDLWNFSASKKKSDPLYFIRQVLEEAKDFDKSVVITDIRTPEELKAFFSLYRTKCIRRLYLIHRDRSLFDEFDKNGMLLGSKLDSNLIRKYQKSNKIVELHNSRRHQSLYHFMRYLDYFFFKEDIMDLSGPSHKQIETNEWRNMVSSYVSQFNINERIV